MTRIKGGWSKTHVATNSSEINIDIAEFGLVMWWHIVGPWKKKQAQNTGKPIASELASQRCSGSSGILPNNDLNSGRMKLTWPGKQWTFIRRLGSSDLKISAIFSTSLEPLSRWSPHRSFTCFFSTEANYNNKNSITDELHEHVHLP